MGHLRGVAVVDIGEVISSFIALVGICLSTWALVLFMGMTFCARAERARDAVEAKPWIALGIGALIFLTLGVVGMGLGNAPEPGARLLGALILLSLLSVAALGASGLSLLIAERMREMDPSLSAFTAFGRSSGLVVLSMLVPVLGWFVVTPIVMLAGLGAGTRALARRAVAPHASAE